MSCEGGLLLHSLNVLDAAKSLLRQTEAGYEFVVCGRSVATISDESLAIICLLHDICKTHYYAVSTRNVKNEETGKWEKAPYYTINDKMPLGHGEKSVFLIQMYMRLTAEEIYAIRWHMGFSEDGVAGTLGTAIEAHPLILAIHTADMIASRLMEATTDNKPMFQADESSDDALDGMTPPPEEEFRLEEVDTR